MGEEGFIEFCCLESVVTVVVVSGDENVALVKGAWSTDGSKSSMELMSSDESISIQIEDGEGVRQVEVWLMGKLDFGAFKLIFEIALLFETVYELVLLEWSEDWLGWVWDRQWLIESISWIRWCKSDWANSSGRQWKWFIESPWAWV